MTAALEVVVEPVERGDVDGHERVAVVETLEGIRKQLTDMDPEIIQIEQKIAVEQNASSREIGVPGITVSVSSDTKRGSMAEQSRAEPRACSSLRSILSSRLLMMPSWSRACPRWQANPLRLCTNPTRSRRLRSPP